MDLWLKIWLYGFMVDCFVFMFDWVVLWLVGYGWLVCWLVNHVNGYDWSVGR